MSVEKCRWSHNVMQDVVVGKWKQLSPERYFMLGQKGINTLYLRKVTDVF